MRKPIILSMLVTLVTAGFYEKPHSYHYHGPPAPLSSDGMVMDTPEVAKARAAHLAMHAEAMEKLKKAQSEYEVYESNEMPTMPGMPTMPAMPTMSMMPTMPMMPAMEPAMEPAMMPAMDRMMPKRQRQRSFAPLGSDGRVVDTPEVAKAKAAHLKAHARAASKAFYELDVYDAPRRNLVYLAPLRVTYTRLSPIGYRGPPAPLGPDGRVIDTPEVVKAREAHMKAHAHAVAMAMQHEDMIR